jgi:hypothetical protein
MSALAPGSDVDGRRINAGLMPLPDSCSEAGGAPKTTDGTGASDRSVAWHNARRHLTRSAPAVVEALAAAAQPDVDPYVNPGADSARDIV